MCTCTEKQQEQSTESRNRARLWQIPKEYLCSIIGTCLSASELTKLSRKMQLDIEAGLAAYDIHVLFVNTAQSNSLDSRLINKYLNRKYSLTINQAKRIKTQNALSEFWHSSKKQNRLAGGYWAILTHPLTPASLCHKLHGEIHMLSHRASRKTTSTGKKIKVQKNRLDVLHEALHVAKTQAQLEIEWRNEELSTLKHKLKDRDAQILSLKNALAKVEQRETRDIIQELQTAKSTMAQQLQQLQERSQSQAKIIATTSKDHDIVNKKHAVLHHKFLELKQENKAMEQMLSSPCTSCQKESNCKGCPSLDLCGRCVLYVGGQHSLIPHYKNIVEGCGGIFIHHDGGKEDQRVKLGKMLSRADAVICPVNCVSHDACLRAKKLCKSQIKPFIPMRSSGLSSLARGLELVMDKATHAH